MIIAGTEPIDAEQIAHAWQADGAKIWAEPIQPGEIRNVAAYMSKRRGMPPADEYSGRLWGTFGGWKSIAQLSRTNAASPIIQAAQIERDLTALDLPPQHQTQHAQPADATDYAEIAGRHLSRLKAIIGKN